MTEILSILPYRYRISGLNIASDFALPARYALDPAGGFPVDVRFHRGDVPERLERPTHMGPTWMVEGNRFLLHLPDVCRIFSVNGRGVTLSPAPFHPIEDTLVFVTGTGLAAILYQRGAMLLHASAVVHEGRAFIFCAQSGAGKSTLAATLNQAGCGFLADDVCAIGQADDGYPLIQSDGRSLRLFADSIGQIGLKAAVGSRVRLRVEKFHVSPAPKPVEMGDGVPLAGVYILADSNAAFPPGITPISPLVAAQVLLNQTYRRRLALAYSSQGQLAMRTAGLLSHVPVFHLHRPRDFARLDETVNRLFTHWNSLL